MLYEVITQDGVGLVIHGHLLRSEGARGAVDVRILVITSYSIHYTKLYEIEP